MTEALEILSEAIEIKSIPDESLSNILDAMQIYSNKESKKFSIWVVNHSEIKLTPYELWHDYMIDSITKENNCDPITAESILLSRDYDF